MRDRRSLAVGSQPERGPEDLKLSSASASVSLGDSPGLAAETCRQAPSSRAGSLPSSEASWTPSASGSASSAASAGAPAAAPPEGPVDGLAGAGPDPVCAVATAGTAGVALAAAITLAVTS